MYLKLLEFLRLLEGVGMDGSFPMRHSMYPQHLRSTRVLDVMKSPWITKPSKRQARVVFKALEQLSYGARLCAEHHKELHRQAY
jgi:hypothetical protein